MVGQKDRNFKITEFLNRSGTTSWRVSGTKKNGTRIRKNYAERSEAYQALADLESEFDGQPEIQKAKRTRLSHEQLAEAEAIFKLAPTRNITKMVRHYLNLEDRVRAKRINLETAISFVESHYHAEKRSLTMTEAYDEFVASKNNTASKTEVHYKSSLKLLRDHAPNKPVHEFSVSDVETILNLYSNPNTRRTYRRAFSAFFNWAVRHHYSLENPCDRLDKIPRDMSQIAALSLDECKRLLYAAMQLQDGAAAASVAIGLFAGLRPSEIRDLKSEDILSDRIRVAGGKLRRKLKRSTPIPPVLAEWLKEFPFTGQPPGWESKLKKLKEATRAKKWVQDIIRHTSITFQAERDKNESMTAFHCGTSVEMMNRHYRDIIDDEKTINHYWSLTPQVLRLNPPKVKLVEKQQIEWPNRQRLTVMVWAKPLIHAAREIGVSNVALKKHCLKNNIDLPPRNHWMTRHRYR